MQLACESEDFTFLDRVYFDSQHRNNTTPDKSDISQVPSASQIEEILFSPCPSVVFGRQPDDDDEMSDFSGEDLFPLHQLSFNNTEIHLPVTYTFTTKYVDNLATEYPVTITSTGRTFSQLVTVTTPNILNREHSEDWIHSAQSCKRDHPFIPSPEHVTPWFTLGIAFTDKVEPEVNEDNLNLSLFRPTSGDAFCEWGELLSGVFETNQPDIANNSIFCNDVQLNTPIFCFDTSPTKLLQSPRNEKDDGNKSTARRDIQDTGDVPKDVSPVTYFNEDIDNDLYLYNIAATYDFLL